MILLGKARGFLTFGRGEPVVPTELGAPERERDASLEAERREDVGPPDLEAGRGGGTATRDADEQGDLEAGGAVEAEERRAAPEPETDHRAVRALG